MNETGRGASVQSTHTERQSMDLRVEIALFNILSENTLPALIGALLVELMTVYFLWQPALAGKLMAWLVALQLITGWMIFAPRLFKKLRASSAVRALWPYAYFMAFYTGVCWACAYYLFSPADQTNWLFLIALLTLTFTGILFLSTEIYSAVLFMTPVFFGIILKHVVAGQITDFYVVGLMGVLFVISLGIAIRQNRIFKASIINAFLHQDMRERLEEQAQELRQINQEKAHFFNAASHDLRQPLHALFLHAGALSEKNQDRFLDKNIDGIQGALHVLEGFLDELLDISRLESGIIRPALKPFLVYPVLVKITHDFLPLAREKNIEIIIHPTDVCVYSDTVLVERMLRNLLHNAIKYTSTGKILLACRKRSATALIQVWDTGVGISAVDRTRIFQDFYQVSNPSRFSKQGVGLGLGIVRRLAEALGHAIEVHSTPGRGSVFSVALPQGDIHSIVYAAPAQYSPFENNSATGKTVLIAEDEDIVVHALTDVLENWGCQVQAVTSENAALALLAQLDHPPDILMVDYQFSRNLTGYELIEKVREKFARPLPAIVMTGNPTVLKQHRHDSNGIYFLLKPVAPAKLRALLQHM